MTRAFQTQQAHMQTALLLDQAALPGLFTPRGNKQFAVYLNAYRARLRGALRDNFETLPRLMGDEAFDTLANVYLSANPSQHYSLRWFGHLLPSFMHAHPGLSLHPAMVDFAQLEWAMRQAFDSADCPALGVTDLVHLAGLPVNDWPGLRFSAHTSAELLTLHWAVGPIWQTLSTGEDMVPEPKEQTHTLLVWRQGLQARWRSLDPAQTDFVRGLMAGLTFADLCAGLTTHLGEAVAAGVAATELRQLIEDGVIHQIQNK